MISLLNRLTLGFLFWALVAFAPLKASAPSSIKANIDFDYMKRYDNVKIESLDGVRCISINYNSVTGEATFTLKFENLNNSPFVFIPLAIHLSLKEKYPEEFAKTKDYWFSINPKETITKNFTMQISSDNAKFLKQELSLYFNYYSPSNSYWVFCWFKAYQHWRSLCLGLIVLIGSCLLFRYRVTIMAWLKSRLKFTKKKK